MKILLTGGGTGGHFYPIIAIAEEINGIAKQNRLLRPELYYMSTDPYNEGLLFENNIAFVLFSDIEQYFTASSYFSRAFII